MSETALKITLDSSSTFEALKPVQDLICSATSPLNQISPELAEDTPQTVVFALGQILCAATNEGKLTVDAVTEFAEQNETFGSMFVRTGFVHALGQAA